MRLRPWLIITCSIWLASGLQSQEVRRALPVVPIPQPAPRALPVSPDQPVPRAQPVLPDQPASSQPSILNENIPSAQSVEPRRPSNSAQDAKASAGSPAEPDSKTRDAANQDEIRLTPGQGPDAQSADPAKAQLAIADGLYIRKLYDLAVAEYEKYLGQFPNDSGRPSAMYRLADCYANLGQEQPALNTYRMLIDEVGTG